MTHGSSDFCLDIGLNMVIPGLGKASGVTYFIYSRFLEMRPKELSPVANILYSYDVYTWSLLGFSLICVALTLYCQYHWEDKVIVIRFLYLIPHIISHLSLSHFSIARPALLK